MVSILKIAFIFIYGKNVLCTNLEFEVYENVQLGHIVGNVFLKLNQWPNHFKSTLLKEEENHNYFTLNKTSGDLIVKSFLDRETICENNEDICEVKLYVDQETNVVKITIRIIDVNDNYPIFESVNKIINIQENSLIGTTFPLPIAHDKDSFKYGVKLYYITKAEGIEQDNLSKYIDKEPQYFIIRNQQIKSKEIYPSLEINRNIDREEFVSFRFLLIATDSGNQTGTCSVTVLVTDVNDNSPTWANSKYKLTIQECQSQGEILELNAFDRDDPNTKNGFVSYRFSDRTEDREKISRIFYINGNKLYLTNKIAGLINKSFVRLFIIAADGNGNMNETSVDITIEDCNDHSPMISITQPYGFIYENQKEKKILTTVKVKDDDKGKNGLFECTLNESGKLNLKTIRQDSRVTIYKIETFTNISFDREELSIYSVEIRCVDYGIPSLSSTQKFSVNIIDVNDNPPKFVNKFEVFSIVENSPIGSIVGHVKALDPDSGVNGRVLYYIMNNDEYFTINNGEIQAKVKFDREINETFDFTVTAVDNGSPPLNDSMMVKVRILDVNDCQPIFGNPYFFTVVESYSSSFKNERIGQIKATDKDLGPNGTVSYKLIDIKSIGSSENLSKIYLERLVKISFDGGVSVYGNLDREMTSSIQLTVHALDYGHPRLSTSTTIIIEISDLNDNSPVFLFPSKSNNYINVSLDSEINKIVGIIQTKDPDQGINGTVKHSLIHSNKQGNFPFKILSEGEIMVTTNLRDFTNYRTLPNRLLIQATDLGKPHNKSSIETLFIRYIPVQSITNQKFTNKNVEDNVWKTKTENKNRKRYSNYNLSENMIVLYSVLTILFFIFLVVLCVLVFIYCSKHNSSNDRYSKKAYQSGNTQLSVDTNFEDIKHLSKTLRGNNEGGTSKMADGSTVCFIGDDGSSYTHLMMLNNSKYTPMIQESETHETLRHMDDNQNQHHMNMDHDLFSYSENFRRQLSYMPPLSCTSNPQKGGDTLTYFSNKEAENYSMLKDKIHVEFNTMSIESDKQVESITNHDNSLDNEEFCQKHRDFKSSYVTSSFV